MVDKEQDWEYGLRAEGHGNEGEKARPVVIGENGFHYRVSGENWGQLPEGCVYREGTAVAVDSKDQVYVFNRGTIPMLVFDHPWQPAAHVGRWGLRQPPRRDHRAGRHRLLRGQRRQHGPAVHARRRAADDPRYAPQAQPPG